MLIRNSICVRIETDGEADRRREAAQQRRRRRRGHVAELEDLLALGHFEQAVGQLRCRRRASSGSSWPLAPSRPTLSGICIGSFLVWPGVGGRTWLTVSRAVLACAIVVERAGKLGRAALRVPEHELREVAARGVGHRSRRNPRPSPPRRHGARNRGPALCGSRRGRAASATCGRPRRPSRRRSPCRSC